MEGQCWTPGCPHFANFISNTTVCPSCWTDLTPTIPPYAARQPTDVAVAFPSHIPDPVLSEQMEYVSSPGDMFSPAVSKLGTTLCQTPITNSIRQVLSDTQAT